VQGASTFFSGVNFLLALAIHLGTFYIFSAGRQFGSIYPALSLAPNVMFNAPSDNSKDNFTVDNKLFDF
jgi:hypothetical protein